MDEQQITKGWKSMENQNQENQVVETVSVPVVNEEVKVKAMPKAQLASLMSLFGGSNSYKNWAEENYINDDDKTDFSFAFVQSLINKEKFDIRLGVPEERHFFLYLLVNVLVKKEIKLLDWLCVQDCNGDGVTEDQLKDIIKLAEVYNDLDKLDDLLNNSFNDLFEVESVVHILLAFSKQKKLFDNMEQWAQDLVLNTIKNEPTFGLENIGPCGPNEQ